MRKIYTFLFCLTMLLYYGAGAQTLTTTTTYLNNNGSGMVTFNLQNTNAFGILITGINGVTGTSGAANAEFWYNTTPITGQPLNFSVPANGWNLISSQSFTGVANTTTTVTQPFLTGLTFLLPAGATYAFAVYAPNQRYFTLPAGATTVSSNGVNMLTGTNIGYGGGTPTAPGTITPRGWIGDIIFVPALPCVSPPTPGTATAAAVNVCNGNTVALSLTGNSIGTGQTYQWQTSPTIAGTYTNVGPSSASTNYIATATSTLYYRVAVTCGASTTYSTPVLVTVPGLFPAGTYTINSAVATGGTNFQTYTAAVDAIKCGTTGPVIFNVATGSGPYNEQIDIPNINTNSATNTITFNCNGTTLTYAGTAAAPHTLMLSGTDYMRFNNLNVVGTDATNGLPAHLWNDANNNNFTNCTFSLPVTSSSTINSAFSISGSATSPTTNGVSGSNNIITGCTMTSGYYCVAIVGNLSSPNTGNQMINCNVKDYYAYGSYNLYNNGLIISGNNFERPTRTTLTSFYGVYASSCTGLLIEKNKVHDGFAAAPTNTGASYCIYISGDGTLGNENKIYNNAIYNIQSSGTVYGLYLLSSDYIKAFHNTVNLDHAGATAGTVYGIYNSGTVGGIEIKNNIVSIARGGTGTKYCLYFTTTMPVSNYNDFYLNSPAGTNYIGYNGTAQTTLAAWQTATSQDANTVTIAPVFTAPLTGDLKPTATALDNLGTPVGITTDILNLARGAVTPDMGAYEFGLPPCPAPTGLAASAITGTSATLSWTAVTGAAGYEYVLDNVVTNPTGAGTATTAVSYSPSGLTPLTTYYMHLRTSCGTGNFSNWVTISFITLCVNPTATITATGATTRCLSDSVMLSANTGTGLSYQWKNGTANITGATTATYYATTSGSYTVVVSISTCSTTSAATAVSLLNRPDTSVIIAPVTGIICLGQSATLTSPSTTGITYTWFKDGTAIPGATANTYAATATGSYQVYVSNGTCGDTSAAKTITVLPRPIPTITSSSTTFCQGSTLTLNGPTPAPGITYQWLLNGTGIAGATNDTYVANATGDYRLVLSNGTCADTSAITTLTVNPLPIATATAAGPTSFCTGGSVVLNANTGTGITYRWLRNNFPITGAIASSYTATTTGSYAVVVTNTATGCLDTSAPAIAVTLFNTPGTTLNASGSLTFCQGGSVTLNAPAGTGYTYVWYRNTAIIAGATNSSYTATTAGTYNAVVTNGPCVSTTISRTVVVNPLPTATITASGATAFCTGGSVILNANTGTGLTYQWRLNTTNIPGATSAAYTATASGGYTVVVSNGTCTNTSNNINVVVSTQPLPVITSVGAPTFCQGNSVTLQATTGVGYTYQWMLNTVNIPGATAATLSATATGNYTVTITNGTCVATSAPFAVSVTPAPPAVITPAGPTSFCQGGNVVLNANRGTGYTYQWTVNSAPIPGATGFTHTAYTTGNYGVNIFDGTCPATSPAVSVTVNDFPTAIITVIGADMSTGTFASYQWYRNGVLIPGATAQNYTAVRDGFYSVVVTDALGCSATSPVQQITALDVNNVNIVAVKLYPNPVENTLHVEAARAVNISIHAIDGKQLLKADRATSIDLSALAQGLYMVRITDAATGALIRVDKVNKK